MKMNLDKLQEEHVKTIRALVKDNIVYLSNLDKYPLPKLKINLKEYDVKHMRDLNG